jgi:hypothetical protein
VFFQEKTMNHRAFCHVAYVFVILLTIMACVLPGQAAQPVPVSNPISIDTAVAGTAQAAAQQTQQSSPPTATIAPEATATATPRISSAGTSLLTLADGSTQFTDYVAGMQMVFPAGWLVFRVGEDEYYAAWNKPETQSQMFMDIFTSTQNLDPKTFRVNALDVRSNYIINNDVTQVGVVFSKDDLRTLKEVKYDETVNHLPFKKYELLSSKFYDAPQGVQALAMEAQWASANGASQTGMGYRKRVIYKIATGIIAIDLVILLEKKDLTTPDFDQIVNSITFLNP